MIQEDVADDLARALAQLRGGQNAGNYARTLLESQKDVLGITVDQRYMYWDRLLQAIESSSIERGSDEYGPDREQYPVRHVRQVDRWIQEREGEWAWLHPRYRWLLKAE